MNKNPKIIQALLGHKSVKKTNTVYNVVVKLRPSQIVEYELRNLIDNLFNNVCFENSENVEGEFFTEEENVIVEDIIEIDENSKIIK